MKVTHSIHGEIMSSCGDANPMLNYPTNGGTKAMMSDEQYDFSFPTQYDKELIV